MTRRTKGFAYSMLSACTFGMIPLFSVPMLRENLTTESILFYRFGFGGLFIYFLLLWQGQNLRISFGDFWRLCVLAVLNIFSAATLIAGFNYLPSGVAATLQFSYPVFTCLIMMIFFGERPRSTTLLAILLAVTGVATLSLLGNQNGDIQLIGVAIELLAGLIYAIYLAILPMLKLRSMDSSKMTFYVFLISTVMMLCYDTAMFGGVQLPHSQLGWLCLVMLGLVTTALSNFTLILSLRIIGSTYTAVLGAVEPVTAIVIGLIAFGEQFTWYIFAGSALIIVAVLLIVLNDRVAESDVPALEATT